MTSRPGEFDGYELHRSRLEETVRVNTHQDQTYMREWLTSHRRVCLLTKQWHFIQPNVQRVVRCSERERRGKRKREREKRDEKIDSERARVPRGEEKWAHLAIVRHRGV